MRWWLLFVSLCLITLVGPVRLQTRPTDVGIDLDRWQRRVGAPRQATDGRGGETAGAGEEKRPAAPNGRESLGLGREISGNSFRDCLDCPQLVVIAPGHFMMGTTGAEAKREMLTDEWANSEHPQHSVAIERRYALGKYAVTRAEFAAFVKATGYDPTGCYGVDPDGSNYRFDPGKSWRNPGFDQGTQHPVLCVSYDDALRYLDWLNTQIKIGADQMLIGQGPYRLPSEAEWEYAARAGTDTARYWGDSADAQCYFANGADAAARRAMPKMTWSIGCDDGYARTAPVGSFRPNAFGLYDMLGNAYQWTGNCWTTNYDWTIPDCRQHVVRGGSWSDVPGGLRAGNRSKDASGTRTDDLGFRVLKTLSP